ncbi:MAG: hypothetical protein HC924_16465 [Synechococcaceae cyanobacterium SM2_3_2]|nr:hypothetical protein [Synechococcaceae cyanobacterium SM2_3_2]
MTATMLKPHYTIQPLDSDIIQIKLSPRVALIRNTHTDKDIAYFGFTSLAQAKTFTTWITEQGIQHYSRSTDEGWCNPRRSERIPTVSYEVKIHRAPRWLIERAVAKDQSR